MNEVYVSSHLQILPIIYNSYDYNFPNTVIDVLRNEIVLFCLNEDVDKLIRTA